MAFPTPPPEDSGLRPMAGFSSTSFLTRINMSNPGVSYPGLHQLSDSGASAVTDMQSSAFAYTPINSPISSVMDHGYGIKDSAVKQTLHKRPLLTQDVVNANPRFKRLQQDLLVLTSFVDNSTLHWRPEWFITDAPYTDLWTLQNPPNVVTEYLPCKPGCVPLFTRRLRRDDDPPTRHIKCWEHWKRYCALYGVPEHFLNTEQIELMRLGLLKSADGKLCEPPRWPRYPEPQAYGKDTYTLDPEFYQNLPSIFKNIGDDKILTVSSTGAIGTIVKEDLFWHESMWKHYSGTGGQMDDYWYVPDVDFEPKVQGRGRRWSYLPWTKEQEESCRRSLVVKLKVKVNFGD